MGDVDPAGVHTLSELASAFQWLRGSMSYAALDKVINPNRGKGTRALPPSTLSNMLHAKSVPTRETVERYLAACGLGDKARKPWLAAWERVATSHLRRPAGGVRVREARPRLLGVHAAIHVDGADGELPPYVPRDLDAELCAAIVAAAERGGLVLLVGSSSAGKTRALVEAVRAVMPEWWLVHPADADAIRRLAVEAPPRAVAWLDELQRYLDTGTGLAASVVRDLIAAGLVLVGTLWPYEYTSRTTRPVLGQPDPHGNDRQLLNLAYVVHVPTEFSPAERSRAESLAGDQRIRIALDSPDGGVTQVLAAGPALVRRWDNAPDPYSRAVITAALDAHRVGVQAPLSRQLLAAAGPGYLTAAEQATASIDWLDTALGYATTVVHGAAALLNPLPAGMGAVAGYVVADYLYQHGRRIRRTVHLPDVVWQALIDHHHPNDTLRLADAAERRGRSQNAEAFYRSASDAGGETAADAGVWPVAVRLARVIAEQGRINEALDILRPRANSGDEAAAHALVDLLVDQGCVDELRERANAGDSNAAYRLVDVLTQQNRLEEGVSMLRERANAESFAARLADLLAQMGRIDELRDLADDGNAHAARLLANLLAAHDRVDELRERASGGDLQARQRLVQLLREHGRVDEAISSLREWAHVGDRKAADLLIWSLAEDGRVDEAAAILRELSDAGDPEAGNQLIRLLAKNAKRIDEGLNVLRERAAAGDWIANGDLVRLLANQGRVDEIRDLADNGNNHAAFALIDLLVEQDRVDEAAGILRNQADAGNWTAALRLALLLAEQGRVDELEAEANAGTPTAAAQLRYILRASEVENPRNG
ncbi:tetratricopeptide repeat protein [Rhizocola hellebori]|uniref:tetratricopeptide repeat protein n=1 Tax=Rhizocola hellebori TaxID=1392758 RepID=UPI0019406BB7|nr:hypothetical protein [Rhizocola hellebori]